MDTKRGRRGEEASESSRKRPVASDESRIDPAQTSQGSPSDETHRQQASSLERPERPEHRIRNTRDRMSETLNEIEYRMSPDHIKHESKEFMYDTVEELKREYHPQRIAKEVGTNMKNTISEHPVSSIIAGLSLSYLLVKSGEEKQRAKHANGEHHPYRHSGAGYPREETRRHHEASGAGEQIRDATEEAAEKTQDMKDQATQQARNMKDQAGEWAEDAGEWAEETGRQARRQARSAKHSMERGTRQVQGQMKDFLFQNPLLAGAIALGTGALLGGMLPSTRMEDEWMGEARDDVMERAEQATEDTVRRASEAAENVAEEAKSAAKDVAETGKEEAERVAKGNDENEKSTEENDNGKTDQKKKAVGSPQ